jgi:hypothetical protein
MPANAVKTTSDITRGFSNVTKSLTVAARGASASEAAVVMDY